MSKDTLFQRILDNKCPICNKPLEKSETVIVKLDEAKLEVHKRHIKYEGK